MAVSPCPLCQDAATFKLAIEIFGESKMSELGFVVQRTPKQDDSPEFYCTTHPQEHNWTGIDSLANSLRKAEY